MNAFGIFGESSGLLLESIVLDILILNQSKNIFPPQREKLISGLDSFVI